MMMIMTMMTSKNYLLTIWDYRSGKFDKINKMPFNDEFPFDDKDGRTWYKVGYRSGWDSGK